MPVFRAQGKLYYYAHVPKCAGSAVSDYLASRCGKLAFENTKYLIDPVDERWTKTSPQHVDWASFTKVIPAGWIDGAFAVVRHPTARLISAYHFQKDVEGTVPEGQSIDDWFASWADKVPMFAFDNHLLPQSQIIPPDATIFKIEDGLDALVPYLDTIIGDELGARTIGSKNTANSGTKAQPSQATLDRIADVYADDFERFDYQPGLPASATSQSTAQGPIARFISKLRGAA